MSRPSVTGGTKKARTGPPGSFVAHGTWGVTISVEKGMSWRAAGFASPRRIEAASHEREEHRRPERGLPGDAASTPLTPSAAPRFSRAAESRSR